MSDNRTPSPPASELLANFQSGGSPPLSSVTVIHVSLSAAEGAVVLGRARQGIDTKANAPLQGAAIEWFQSLSFSPITAKQASRALAQAIDVYERAYGKIPDDP